MLGITTSTCHGNRVGFHVEWSKSQRQHRNGPARAQSTALPHGQQPTRYVVSTRRPAAGCSSPGFIAAEQRKNSHIPCCNIFHLRRNAPTSSTITPQSCNDSGVGAIMGVSPNRLLGRGFCDIIASHQTTQQRTSCRFGTSIEHVSL